MVYERSMKEALVSETDPIALRPVQPGATLSQDSAKWLSQTRAHGPVCFTRQELQDILNVYGRNVAAGEWRDYAIDMEQRESDVLNLPANQRNAALSHREEPEAWQASRCASASSQQPA